MKGLISSIKKIVLIVFTFFMTIKNRIMAMNIPLAPSLYGPPPPSAGEILSRIVKYLSIPIVIIIGLIVFIVKFIKSKKIKIVLSIILSLAIILFCIVIIQNSDILFN